MKVRILDSRALSEISPAALAGYARSAGWKKSGPFGKHADVYVGSNRPELTLPRTDQLSDYASSISRLIGILGEFSNKDEISIYRELIGADQDVIRVRSIAAADDGSVPINNGVEMVAQAREMLLAAACATSTPQTVYRAGANREATDYLKNVRLGQTEHGSFVVTMMSPVPPLLQIPLDHISVDFEDEPFERQVTRRLVEALKASRDAAEQAHTGDGAPAFDRAVAAGVSANLCDAIARLLSGTHGLEVSVDWAKIRPTGENRRSVRFSENDEGAFKEAARSFRNRAPRPDQKLFGAVLKLSRDERQLEGQVTFKVDLDDKTISVGAMLDQQNYSTAVRAHDARNPVIVTGDLERVNQRWRLTNAIVREFVSDGENEGENP